MTDFQGAPTAKRLAVFLRCKMSFMARRDRYCAATKCRRALLVASTVRLGKLNEARVAAARLIEATPDFTVAGFERMAQSFLSRPELVAAISSALTEAGLP